MDRIIEIDPANRLALVEPGVLNADLSRAEHGLLYPPDPSSWELCSIGGNLSTNSGRDIKRALDPQGILNPGKVFG